jgi:hypothetical protein
MAGDTGRAQLQEQKLKGSWTPYASTIEQRRARRKMLEPVGCLVEAAGVELITMLITRKLLIL